jgi:hypothetical protein
VNKWLNIGAKKSKFGQPGCQVDNKEDVSVYSESTYSKISSINKSAQRKVGLRVNINTKFSCLNVDRKMIIKMQSNRLISAMNQDDCSNGSISNMNSGKSKFEKIEVVLLAQSISPKRPNEYSTFKNIVLELGENEVKLDEVSCSSVRSDKSPCYDYDKTSEEILHNDGVILNLQKLDNSDTVTIPSNVLPEEGREGSLSIIKKIKGRLFSEEAEECSTATGNTQAGKNFAENIGEKGILNSSTTNNDVKCIDKLISKNRNKGMHGKKSVSFSDKEKKIVSKLRMISSKYITIFIDSWIEFYLYIPKFSKQNARIKSKFIRQRANASMITSNNRPLSLPISPYFKGRKMSNMPEKKDANKLDHTIVERANFKSKLPSKIDDFQSFNPNLVKRWVRHTKLKPFKMTSELSKNFNTL